MRRSGTNGWFSDISPSGHLPRSSKHHQTIGRRLQWPSVVAAALVGSCHWLAWLARMKALTFSIATTVTLCGCGTASLPLSPANAFLEATSLCTALNDPEPYVGKHLLVRGYLTRTPAGGEFWDEGCQGFLLLKLLPETARARRLRSLLGTYLAHSNTRPPRAAVVYSGTFTDISPAVICDGPSCSQFTLEGAEMVAVRPH